MKPKKEYYIEYVAIEHQIKATAIDPETGTEASVICPTKTTRNEMATLAIKKLEYVMKKREDKELRND